MSVTVATDSSSPFSSTEGPVGGELPGWVLIDLVRARAFLRAGVGTIDRLLGNGLRVGAYGELESALIETSHAAHRALTALDEPMAEAPEADPGSESPMIRRDAVGSRLESRVDRFRPKGEA